MSPVFVHSDLEFSVDLPPVGSAGAERLSGHIGGTGRTVEITLHETLPFGLRLAGSLLKTVASRAYEAGLTVRLVDSSGPLADLGRVKPNLAGLVLLRSRRIRLGAWRTISPYLRGGGRRRASLEDMLPPPTLLPIMPTWRRQPRRVTTTHDPDGGGRPRFYFPGEVNHLPGDRTREFYLRVGRVTTIGSDEHCHLRLDGLQPLHAEVRRDDLDEYWIVGVAGAPLRVNGAAVDKGRLRTGTRVELGRWTMSYFRAEHADHGRPHGGRIGGEAGHQIPQELPVYRQPTGPR